MQKETTVVGNARKCRNINKQGIAGGSDSDMLIAMGASAVGATKWISSLKSGPSLLAGVGLGIGESESDNWLVSKFGRFSLRSPNTQALFKDC